jgi:uncharacterized protein (TIGR02246 family)
MPALSADDQAAINALWERYGEAITSNKDGAAAAALYSEDCEVVGIDGSLLRGRQEIADYYKVQLSGKYAKLKMSDVAFELPRAISDTVAIINGSWMVHGLKPEAVRVRSTMILRRDPEGWRYVAARFMAALPS